MPTHTRRKGNMRWLAQVKLGGKIVASKMFPDGPHGGKEFKAALLWEEQTRTTILRGQARAEAQPPTPTACSTHDWATAYLSDVQRRMSDSTYKEKREVFRRFLKKHPDNPAVNSITPAMALKFLQDEFDRRSGYAANKDRKNLVAAWNWAARYIDDFPDSRNPFQAVARFPEKRSPRYVPPEADFWAVVALATQQDRAMLLTFLYTAARRGEVFRLTWQDVDFKEERIKLGTKKTKDGSMRHDWLPLLPELKAELLAWRRDTPNKNSDHVFTVAGEGRFENQYEGEQFQKRQHMLRKLCKRAGVKPFGFHSIRHMTASALYRAGYPPATIQVLLRHESATTTARYLKSLGFVFDELRGALAIFADAHIRNDPQNRIGTGTISNKIIALR